MNAQDWRSYFQQNARDRRAIPWHEGGYVPAQWRPVLTWLARQLGAGGSRAGDGDWVVAMELCAAERREDARMLRRLLVGEAPAEPRLAGRRALQFGLAGDLVALNALAIVRRSTNGGAVAVVCEQLAHDLQFQVRFKCECLRGRAWGRRWLVGVSVAGLWLRWRVPGVWENYRAACAAVAGRTGFGDVPGVRARRRWYYWPKAMREAPRLDARRPVGAMRERLVLLINPFYRKDPHASFGKHVLTPSVALTSLAAATPAGWEVKLWDENLLQGPPPVNPLPAVVGITVHLTFARRAFALADWYRQRGANVILGGPHVMACAEECAAHADALAVGEGVQVWPEILRDAAAGRLARVYRGDYRRPFAEEPAPQRALVPRWGFLTTGSVIATRGCLNRCGFCYLATEELAMPYQMRDVKEVVAEIRATGEPYAVFLDNNLGARPEYLRRLCRELRPLEIIWSAAVTLDVTDDPVVVREMARAGCTGVFVGFESLTAQNLVEARKRTARPEDFGRRVEMLHDHGIQVNGSFVLGFDHDRRDCFAQTVDWIERYRLECATFHVLTPYPGTPLFRELAATGRLLHRDWELYDTAHVVFRPRHMSAEELAEGYAWCYERLFSHQSIWRRRPAEPSAVVPYLAMSYLYKRANLFWHLLIRHRLTHAVWRPVVEHSRRRHVQFRKRLDEPLPARSFAVVPASV